MGPRRRSYTPEYQEHSVASVIDGGRPVAEVACNIQRTAPLPAAAILAPEALRRLETNDGASLQLTALGTHRYPCCLQHRRMPRTDEPAGLGRADS